MRDPIKLIVAGTDAQRQKLYSPENIEKGEFPTDLREIYSQMMIETREVHDEIFPTKDIDYEKTRLEFADIANFAHIGVLACNKKLLEIEIEKRR